MFTYRTKRMLVLAYYQIWKQFIVHVSQRWEISRCYRIDDWYIFVLVLLSQHTQFWQMRSQFITFITSNSYEALVQFSSYNVVTKFHYIKLNISRDDVFLWIISTIEKSVSSNYVSKKFILSVYHIMCFNGRNKLIMYYSIQCQ